MRILIVDDHVIVSHGLAAVLSSRQEFTVVGQAHTGRDAIQLFEELLPDITLMDMRLPDMEGSEAITAIRERWPDAKIIVLSAFGNEECVFRCMHAGARGYLLKEAPIEQILNAVAAVDQGEVCMPASRVAQLAARMTHTPLTRRELEVLELVAKGNSNVRVGALLNITEGTVKSHINSILAKLDVGDRTHAVTRAVERGLIRLE